MLARLTWWFGPPADPPSPPAASGRQRDEDGAPWPAEPVVERLRGGDERALREVWDAHYARLLALARRYMGSHDAAADVVQQVFVALWERRATLAPRRTLAAHLAGAVRFRALHELRQGRIRDGATARAGVTMDDVASVPNLGDVQLDADETAAAVRAALAALTPRVREIFLMHRESGLTAPQIAEVLGIGTQVVYNQLSKALKALAAGLRTLE